MKKGAVIGTKDSDLIGSLTPSQPVQLLNPVWYYNWGLMPMSGGGKRTKYHPIHIHGV